MPITELHINEPKRVRTISIDRLIERLLQCRQTWPDAQVALNEPNQCLDLYRRVDNFRGEHLFQFLWE